MTGSSAREYNSLIKKLKVLIVNKYNEHHFWNNFVIFPISAVVILVILVILAVIAAKLACAKYLVA